MFNLLYSDSYMQSTSMYLRGRVNVNASFPSPTRGSTSGPLSTVSTVTYKRCAAQQIGPTVNFIGWLVGWLVGWFVVVVVVVAVVVDVGGSCGVVAVVVVVVVGNIMPFVWWWWWWWWWWWGAVNMLPYHLRCPMQWNRWCWDLNGMITDDNWWFLAFF